MKEVTRMLKRIVSATVVVGALAFGTSTLLASPSLTECADDGDIYLGTCIDNVDCKVKCVAAHPAIPPGEIEGRCIGGCCICLY